MLPNETSNFVRILNAFFQDEDAQGFNPTDYQIQLTRRVRGLPLWFSLAMHGTNRYKVAIERGLQLAQIAGRLIQDNPLVELVREPSLSCVLFRRLGWQAENYKKWTFSNHDKGFALVAPTKWQFFRNRGTFLFYQPGHDRA